MLKYVKGFFKYKDLLKELVIRDVKVRYRNSVLGLLWTLLNPLLMMAVLTVVFSTLFESTIENFPVYLLSGQIIYNFFSESTSMAMGSVLGSGALIKKVYIPKYLLPLSKVISTLVNLLASMIALIIVMVITGIEFRFTAFYSIFPIIYIFVFATGIGMILSAIAVFFRDIIHFYSVLLTVWMYLTPVFYPVDILPEATQKFVGYNPLAVIISCMREATIYGRIPSLSANLYCIICSAVVMFIGFIFFYKSQDKFILYL